MAPPSPSSPPSPSLRTSSRAGLNRGPHPYQGCALPTELRERHLGRTVGRAERLLPLLCTFVRLSACPSVQPVRSGRRDSNPRPSAWKADALPTELHPRLTTHRSACPTVSLSARHGGGRIRTYVGQSPADLQSATISHSVTPPNLHPPISETEPRRREAGSIPHLWAFRYADPTGWWPKPLKRKCL
jgi:hypothetical protein